MEDRLWSRSASRGCTAPILGAAVLVVGGSPTLTPCNREEETGLLRASNGKVFDPPRASVGSMVCGPPSGAGGGSVGAARIFVVILTGSV